MNKEEFLKLSDLDKVKYSIEESLKEHKGYEREYFKGSAAMGESILQTIKQVKEFAITDVSQQRELLKAYAELIQKDYTNHFFDDALEESIDQFLSL